ncbi:MAG: hypothetical protein GX992_02110 [Clostridium sp.]|nr:hypothetical protein [Clostridium sp.]
MGEYAKQLENKIIEKNRLLDYYSKRPEANEPKLKNVEAELDGLLYKYYQELKRKVQ